jgi:hypothetical protein
MALRPSQPEIITVNSEDLQTQIRDLLPSQNGFGSELQATNVITPIIDLTAAAEGSGLVQYAQRAWDFSTTHQKIVNTTTTIVNQTGFWQVDANATYVSGAAGATATLQINDGLATKTIWQVDIINSGVGVHGNSIGTWSEVVWLRAGDSLEGVSGSANLNLNVSVRQVVDPQGVVQNPNGYPV